MIEGDPAALRPPDSGPPNDPSAKTAVAKPPPGKAKESAVTKPRAGKPAAKPEAEVWLDVFDRAAESGKPILLYFTAEASPACRTMEKLLLRQKAVVDQAAKYHSVQIAVDYVSPDLLRTFKVTQAPTIVLCGSAGKPRTRLVGRQDPERLAATLEAFVGADRKAREKARAKPEAAAEPAGLAPGGTKAPDPVGRK